MPDKTASRSALASQRTLWLVGTAIVASSIVALLLIDLGEGSPCLILATTGVACPGCGMTRATAALLRGDWTSVWTLHPLAPLVAMEVLVGWVWWGWSVLVRRTRVDETILLWLLVGNVGLLVLVWLVRLVSGSLPS